MLLPPILAAPAIWHLTHLGPRYQAFWARSPDMAAVGGIVQAQTGSAFYVGGWRFSLGWLQWLVVAVFATLWIVAFLREDRRRTRIALTIALLFFLVLPIAAGWIVPEVSGHHRYFMVTLPFMVLLAVRGWNCVGVAVRVVAAVMLLSALAWGTIRYFTVWQKGNVKQAAAYVQGLATQDSVLVVPGYRRSLWDFYDRTGLHIVDEVDVDLDEIAKYRRVILITHDIPDEIRDEMDGRWRLLLRRVYPANFSLGLTVSLYAPGP